MASKVGERGYGYGFILWNSEILPVKTLVIPYARIGTGQEYITGSEDKEVTVDTQVVVNGKKETRKTTYKPFTRKIDERNGAEAFMSGPAYPKRRYPSCKFHVPVAIRSELDQTILKQIVGLGSEKEKTDSWKYFPTMTEAEHFVAKNHAAKKYKEAEDLLYDEKTRIEDLQASLKAAVAAQRKATKAKNLTQKKLDKGLIEKGEAEEVAMKAIDRHAKEKEIQAEEAAKLRAELKIAQAEIKELSKKKKKD